MDWIYFIILVLAFASPVILFVLFMILMVSYNKHIYKKNEKHNIEMCKRRMELWNSMKKE